MDRIAADNIYQVTSAETGGAAVPVPSLEDVIAAMSEQDQKSMRDSIASLPPCMKVVPVMYKKISSEENRKTIEEFMESVEPLFLKKLVRDYEKELRASGFCDHAIENMRRGHEPSDKDGNPYNYNTDHIIERAGGGLMSLTKSPDPDMQKDEEAPSESFEVNHFRNFFFLPREVHEIKNDINRLQLKDIQSGETRLIYMAIQDKSYGPEPFYKADGKFGPNTTAALLEEASVFPGMTSSMRASRLLDKFHETPEGAMLRDLFASGVQGDALQSSIQDVLGNGDKLAAERYARVTDAFDHALFCWEKSREGCEKEAAKGPRSFRKQVKEYKEYFGAFKENFKSFVTSDGRSAAPLLDKMEKALDATLCPAPDPSQGAVNNKKPSI